MVFPAKGWPVAEQTMLSFTKKTDYALIALAYLAGEPNRMASAREIGDRHNVPIPLLMNVLKTLARSGVIRSSRGARGGYALAIDPSEVTLAKLLEVVEGPLRFVQCAGHARQDPSMGLICELEKSCPVRTPTMRIHTRLKEFLSTVTLSEIIEDVEPLPRSFGPAEAKEPVDEKACLS